MKKQNEKLLDELCIDGTKYKTEFTEKFKNRTKWKMPSKNCVCAFIPGKVVKVCITEGQKIKEGDNLIILEAMKMRNHLTSPVAGIVKEIKVKQGQIVEKGQIIVTLEKK